MKVENVVRKLRFSELSGFDAVMSAEAAGVLRRLCDENRVRLAERGEAVHLLNEARISRALERQRRRMSVLLTVVTVLNLLIAVWGVRPW